MYLVLVALVVFGCLGLLGSLVILMCHVPLTVYNILTVSSLLILDPYLDIIGI